MIEFIDGPAQHCKSLLLRRTPLYLRVTHREGLGGTKKTGAWDALDQLSDRADPAETLYVYRLVETGPWLHLRMERCSGFYRRAKYRFVQDQPEDGVMRSTERWREWAEAEARKEMPYV